MLHVKLCPCKMRGLAWAAQRPWAWPSMASLTGHACLLLIQPSVQTPAAHARRCWLHSKQTADQDHSVIFSALHQHRCSGQAAHRQHSRVISECLPELPAQQQQKQPDQGPHDQPH